MRSLIPGTVLRSARVMGRAHHLGAGVAMLALALTALPAAAGVAAASSGRAARAAALTSAQRAAQNDTTASENDLRTGWDRHEPGLRPATVASSQIRPGVLEPRSTDRCMRSRW